MSLIVIGINIIAIRLEQEAQWINFVITGILVPISIFIIYKVVFRYKIVRMGNGQIEVKYPLFGKSTCYALKEVESWTETVIKTGKTSTYKELEITFLPGQKITMGFKEYSEYDKMLKYLSQKIPKQKKQLS
jgi:hypothetical protein